MTAQRLTRLLTLVVTLAPLALAARTDCGSLAALKLLHTSITFAQSVAPIRTRPLWPFPKVARWNGQGSTDDAANFACVDPPSAEGSQEGERH